MSFYNSLVSEAFQFGRLHRFVGTVRKLYTISGKSNKNISNIVSVLNIF